MEMNFSNFANTFPGHLQNLLMSAPTTATAHLDLPWRVHLSCADLSPPIFLMGKPRLSCQIFWKFLQGCFLGSLSVFPCSVASGEKQALCASVFPPVK